MTSVDIVLNTPVTWSFVSGIYLHAKFVIDLTDPTQLIARGIW